MTDRLPPASRLPEAAMPEFPPSLIQKAHEKAHPSIDRRRRTGTRSRQVRVKGRSPIRHPVPLQRSLLWIPVIERSSDTDLSRAVFGNSAPELCPGKSLALAG
jgi:hypothetical protein